MQYDRRMKDFIALMARYHRNVYVFSSFSCCLGSEMNARSYHIASIGVFLFQRIKCRFALNPKSIPGAKAAAVSIIEELGAF
jgi:hypothetical protein